MAKMIFVNLPVSDVARSTAFYEAIGFEKNAQFSNEQASIDGMVRHDILMLLAQPFYATFTSKEIADTRAHQCALLALSFDSRADVDAITEAALAAGGTRSRIRRRPGLHVQPRVRGFRRPYGFGTFWMDMAAANAADAAGELHQPVVELKTAAGMPVKGLAAP